MTGAIEVWSLGARLGESALYDPRIDAVLFVDIKGCKLHCYSLGDGTQRTWEAPGLMSWIALRSAGGYVAGVAGSIGVLTMDPFDFEPKAEPAFPIGSYRLNDAKVDANGELWFGSMNNLEQDDRGDLTILGTNWRQRKVDGGWRIPNGPAFSKDGSRVYAAETAAGVIYCLELDTDGRVIVKRPMIRFEPDWGYPDGMTVDCEDGLWVAHWGGARVSRFTPSGDLDRSLPLPTSLVTSCCFGGPELNRLFVTTAALDTPDGPTAGALFELDPGVRGLASNPFTER